MKTIREPAVDIEVYAECDVLVVGAGAAGHSAAVAAARAGCRKVVLMERYGYSGGDVTGDYVLMVPKLSWKTLPFVRGLQEEWFDRMEKAAPGSTYGPKMKDIGKVNPMLAYTYSNMSDITSVSEPHGLIRTVYYDGPQLEIELDLMLLELNDRIQILYHSWGTKPIMDGDVCKGVYFESKEGRKAVLAKVVIDATGDGDLYRQSGAPYEDLSGAGTRSHNTTLAWRVGGVNTQYLIDWKRDHPELWRELCKEVSARSGIAGSAPFWTEPHGNCLVFNRHVNVNCSTVKDLTATELNTRKGIRAVIEYCKEALPGAYKDMYLLSIAPQTGVRCSRRLKGEYVMTAKDWALGIEHDDVIAWHSTICRLNDCGPVEIPYRAILPQKVDNLLAPGRHVSADGLAIDWINLIPQCVGTGQAAGVAAAVAVADGVGTHAVDIRKVQNILIDQNVPLPRNDRVDPAYAELVKEFDKGLYTDAAKKAKEDPSSLDQLKPFGA